jgi:2-polyprenyl-3-methyl-5-hydroxy-6-metoxy-1,4-benzoquinol methylase
MAERYRTDVDPHAANNPHAFALELVGSGHHVLEIGCSTGHVTSRLIEAGNTVVGVELDETAAAEARTVAGVVHVVDLDITPVSSVESGPFDVILLGDVLEHVRDPSPVLADIASLLGHEGRLVISVPNAAHVDVRLMLLEGRIEYQHDGLLDRTHLRWFTKESLRQLLADCGFVTTRLRRVVFPIGGSNVPWDSAVHAGATIEFVMADPEAETYQYVVECQRIGVAPDGPDPLEPIPFSWPDTECSRELIGDLRREQQTLQSELHAWENSRLARYTRPLRALSGRMQRRVSRLRA